MGTVVVAEGVRGPRGSPLVWGTRPVRMCSRHTAHASAGMQVGRALAAAPRG